MPKSNQYLLLPDISLIHFIKLLFYKLDGTNWIDVCPDNNNLLATVGDGRNVKIYDRRGSKIVKIIDTLHSCNISQITSYS